MDTKPAFVACLSDDKQRLQLSYDLSFIRQLMERSSGSMVPFTCFTLSPKIKVNRSYPRAFSQGFTFDDTAYGEDSAGGRPATDGGSAYAVCEMLQDPRRGLPLSDIAILCKRFTVAAAIHAAGRTKCLKLLGGADPRLDVRWPVFGYPMLCAMVAKPFPLDEEKGWSRLMQCVFAVALTREIRERGIGLEVVAREGFGSLFPTVADLPHGIRLDPGLLHPAEGAAAISAALKVLDGFVELIQQKAKPSKRQEWVGKMNAMGGQYLAAVDRLTHLLHARFSAGSKASAKDYAEAIDTTTDATIAFELGPPGPDRRIEYSIPFMNVGGGRSKTRPKERTREETGYGSESDDDDDAVESTPLPIPRDRAPKKPVEAERGPRELFQLRKYSVVSGMAALDMAVVHGANHSSMLLTGSPSKLTTFAEYFELGMFSLFKQIRDKVGLNVLVCDGAPNPINIPEAIPALQTSNLAAIVVDTTNNTTGEKAWFLAIFRQMLAPGGVVILVDSASKHPTGGDLVHGILRVYGSPAAIEQFDRVLLKHLEGREGLAYRQTVLAPSEALVRKAMLEGRLLTRNRDLFDGVGQ